MAYAKKTWVTGDVITADALNNIENGVASIDTRTVGKFVFVTDDIQSDAPAPSGANEGDVVIDSHYDVYQVTGGKCSLKGTIKGADGAAGPKGDKGDVGVTGPQGPKGDKGDPGMTPQPAINDVAANADVAALATAHNALLAALRKAGVIAAK